MQLLLHKDGALSVYHHNQGETPPRYMMITSLNTLLPLKAPDDLKVGMGERLYRLMVRTAHYDVYEEQ
jgi:hypothetical protein